MGAHGRIYGFGNNPPNSTYYDRGKFGRMFPQLPPFAADTPTLRGELNELGKKDGPMDAQDNLATGPKELIGNPGPINLDNPNMTAGMTFLGQFLDHDMTLDGTSSLEQQVDPETIQNFRRPVFELDSLYGMGPHASPHLYDQSVNDGLTNLLCEVNLGSGALSRDGEDKFDVPRNSQGIALIGDPRNDENLVISQLQVAFIRFHNAVVAHVESERLLTSANEIFAEAQRLVRWHYQWIILHEFLPKTVGQALVDDILQNGRKYYDWRNEPFIPVEFSVGAYRFGHSQVRPSYRVNFGPRAGAEFFAFIFNEPQSDPSDPEDMRGGCRAPRRFIDWQTFFEFGDGNARNNKRIDTKLSTALFDLPKIPSFEPQSLAQRNLLRSLTFRMPSGQSIARAMAQEMLLPADLADLPASLRERTPLWFYILREAEVMADARRLGPVAGRIVAEVMIGLLQGDSMSFVNQDPRWTPSLACGGDFKMIDLLKIARVITML